MQHQEMKRKKRALNRWLRERVARSQQIYRKTTRGSVKTSKLIHLTIITPQLSKRDKRIAVQFAYPPQNTSGKAYFSFKMQLQPHAAYG